LEVEQSPLSHVRPAAAAAMADGGEEEAGQPTGPHRRWKGRREKGKTSLEGTQRKGCGCWACLPLLREAAVMLVAARAGRPEVAVMGPFPLVPLPSRPGGLSRPQVRLGCWRLADPGIGVPRWGRATAPSRQMDSGVSEQGVVARWCMRHSRPLIATPAPSR